MQLKVNQIPNSKSILIPVANENLNHRFISDFKEIECNGEYFSVFDYFVYLKTDYYPRSLMKLATGIDLKSEDIWRKYPNSDSIILFVCERIEKDKEEIKLEVKSLSLYD